MLLASCASNEKNIDLTDPITSSNIEMKLGNSRFFKKSESKRFVRLVYRGGIPEVYTIQLEIWKEKAVDKDGIKSKTFKALYDYRLKGIVKVLSENGNASLSKPYRFKVNNKEYFGRWVDAPEKGGSRIWLVSILHKNRMINVMYIGKKVLNYRDQFDMAIFPFLRDLDSMYLPKIK